jgi:phosphocarrier protein
MIDGNVIISNELGLHARAASKLVKIASKYESETQLSLNEVTANCKSIMGLMMLGGIKGSCLHLSANGADESQAYDAVKNLIENKFDEAY